jgi:hypothetical protein
MREVRLVPETLSAEVISAGSIPNSPALRESVLSCKLSRYRNVSILKGMFRNKIGAHVSISLCNYDPRKSSRWTTLRLKQSSLSSRAHTEPSYFVEHSDGNCTTTFRSTTENEALLIVWSAPTPGQGATARNLLCQVPPPSYEVRDGTVQSADPK